MKKIIILFTLVLIIILSICFTVFAGTYVGNQRSGIFHFETCEWAQKISPYNAVEINSRQEAIKIYHMRPCKVCRP